MWYSHYFSWTDSRHYYKLIVYSISLVLLYFFFSSERPQRMISFDLVDLVVALIPFSYFWWCWKFPRLLVSSIVRFPLPPPLHTPSRRASHFSHEIGLWECGNDDYKSKASFYIYYLKNCILSSWLSNTEYLIHWVSWYLLGNHWLFSSLDIVYLRLGRYASSLERLGGVNISNIHITKTFWDQRICKVNP